MAIRTATGAIKGAPASGPRLPRVPLVLLAIVGAAAAWTVIDPSIEEAAGPLIVILGNGTAGFLMVRNSRSLPYAERRAWSLVGLGLLLAASGILVVGIINEATGNAAAFGPTDVLFIATYVLVVGGLASLPHVRGGAVQRLRVWLDGLIGAVSLGTVLWVTFLAEPVLAVSSAPTWERFAGSAYPIIDVASLIVVMIVAVRRGALRFDPRLLFIGMGFASQAIADIRFLTSGIGRTFDEASPDFTFYLIASFCYLMTGLLVARRPAPREYADRRAALMPMIAPYAAAIGLVGLLFARIVGSDLDTLTVELLVATLMVGGLVVGRQAVAIRENRMLVERERAALVSSISHELRTPLTAMLGFLEVLDEDDIPLDPQEREELTGIVHQQAVYMSRIVADLIMLARSQATEISLSESAVPVRSAIDAALAAIPDSAAGTQVSCSDDLVIYADRDRLQQVLVNLLVNAIRYGGEYRAVVARIDRDHVVIEVHDNGAGVPPRYVLKIWERFERGPNRYDAANPGSGIGLAVVEAVATAHGGSAEYQRSTLLGGACFRVRLPARRIVESVPLTAPSEDTAA